MIKLVTFVLAFLVVGIFGENQFQKVSATSADFSVKPILPENQRVSGISYFDFELMPKEAQIIEFDLTNNSDKEKLYNVEVNTARTNMNGVIDYTEGEMDATLPIVFSDIVTVTPELTVAAGATIRVPIQLKMPDVGFEGILLGGVRVSEVIGDNEQDEQISNRFSYSIAVVLSQGSNVPVLEMDLLDVHVEQLNRRNVISANLQNKASMIVNDLTVDARVFREGQEKPLFHREEKGLRMAPNSNFNFGVTTDNQPLRSGKYRMEVKAMVDDQEWEWSKDFNITEEKAKEMNSTAVELEADNTTLYLWIAGVLVGGSLLLILVLIVRNNKIKK